MLNSKQRSFLRGMANQMCPIFQIGKGGIGEELYLQIGNALEARELIKVSVLDTCGYTAREAAEAFAENLACDVVAVSGNRFVLYRESTKKKQKIELPK